MVKLLVGALVMLAVTAVARAEGDAPTVAASPLGFTMKDIDGKEIDLGSYRGKTVLMVNVASKCGYTPQYTGLEKLYEKYKDKGFVILAFPANNFKGQEPGTNEQIKDFCTGADSKYHVTFPLFAKISVKGEDEAALYKLLTQFTEGEATGDVAWNFEKFLIGKDGKIVGRYRSKVKPDDAILTKAIDAEIAK